MYHLSIQNQRVEKSKLNAYRWRDKIVLMRLLIKKKLLELNSNNCSRALPWNLHENEMIFFLHIMDIPTY